MKEIADSKKYIAGWSIVALAIATSAVGYARDNSGALYGGMFVVVFGLGFAREAALKKEKAPHLPWVRWYHLVAVALVVSVTVSWLWWNVLK